MDKRFWAIIGVIIAIFAGVLWINGNKNDNNGQASGNAQPTSHLKGNTTSAVKFVEYGDYQCPYCAQYQPVLSQVFQKYKDTVSFQFRNLPLTQIHQNGLAGARAAEAADLQGKFWEMHDLLYQNQNSWAQSSNPLSMFDAYAQQLGLNASQFDKDFASSKVNDRINADKAEFNKTGQQLSTPTFFLNGKKITATTLDEFSKLIDEALKNK
ncbi:MAG TPA: thioredoxin domain-containing protein [Candidatus Saccharimonadales bacterium]